MPPGSAAASCAAASSIASGSPSSAGRWRRPRPAFAGVSAKSGLTALRAVDEQLARRGTRGARLERCRRRGIRRRQRRHLVDALAADAQHDAARDEEGRAVGASGVQPDDRGRRVDDLLEVVEHDEHAAPARARARCAPRGRASPLSRMPSPYAIVGSRSAGSSTFSRATKYGAVGEEVLGRARGLDREAALADPAGADQPDDPVARRGASSSRTSAISPLAADHARCTGRHARDERGRGCRIRSPRRRADSSKRSARRVARSPATCSSSCSAVSNGR